MNRLILMLATLVALPASTALANSDLAQVEITQVEMAQVVTQGGRPVDCLSPIAVNKVDGQSRILPAQGFKIEPGIHSLNARAILDTTFCKVARGGNRGGYAPDLEVDFEAGKTYHIGYDHRSSNRDEWKLVVWKVE